MMNMSEPSSRQSAAAKRRWDEQKAGAGYYAALAPTTTPTRKFLRLAMLNDADDATSAITPPVTVVLEGRSICHRVHLHRHSGYQSLAAALRCLFVDADANGHEPAGLDLSNAVPGHLVAYEDMEDDLLLAGDLNWKDFVRVAKRIRIIPAEASRRGRKL